MQVCPSVSHLTVVSPKVGVLLWHDVEDWISPEKHGETRDMTVCGMGRQLDELMIRLDTSTIREISIAIASLDQKDNP